MNRVESNLPERPFSALWLGADVDWAYRREESEDLQGLGRILQMIGNAVHIIAGGKQISVQFASDQHAVSILPEQHIMLSPVLLKNRPAGMGMADAVDYLFAEALHEAAHCLETDFTAAEKLPAFDFIVFHMIEDMYIEKKLSLRYPGYMPYFIKRNQREYVTENQDWGVDPASVVLNQFLYALHLTELDESLDRLIEDMACETVHIIDDALENGVELDRMELSRKIASALKELVRRTETGEKINVAFESGYDSSASALAAFQAAGNIRTRHLDSLHTDYKTGGLSDWATRQIERQVEADNQSYQDLVVDDGTETYFLTVPALDSSAADRYEASFCRVLPYVHYLRNRFAWANTPIERMEKLLPIGELDEEYLYYAPFYPKFFCQREEQESRIERQAIYLLVDQSHSVSLPASPSISLTRSEFSMDLATIFVEGLSGIAALALTVLGYSTRPGTGIMEISELFQTGVHERKARLGALVPKEATPEYSALQYVWNRAQIECGPRRKIFIILSDGKPDDYTHSSEAEHREKIKAAVRKIQLEGDMCIHFSLAEEANGTELYPYSITFSGNYQESLDRFIRLLTSML